MKEVKTPTMEEKPKTEGWERHWEECNAQLEKSGGVNPHAYRLGFLKAQKLAGGSLSPTESGPYTLDKDTKEHYGEEYFWRIFGPDVKGSGTVTRPCIAKVWDEQTAIRIVNFLNAEAPTEKPSQYVPFQTCPKCLGDGHLGRYNSPAYMATSVFPTCDVCHGSKIIAQSLVVDNPEPLSDKDKRIAELENLLRFERGKKGNAPF